MQKDDWPITIAHPEHLKCVHWWGKNNYGHTLKLYSCLLYIDAINQNTLPIMLTNGYIYVTPKILIKFLDHVKLVMFWKRQTKSANFNTKKLYQQMDIVLLSKDTKLLTHSYPSFVSVLLGI